MTELEVGQRWKANDGQVVCVIDSISRKLGIIVTRFETSGWLMTHTLEWATENFNEQWTLQTDAPKETIVSPNHYIGDNGLEVEIVLQNFVPRYANSYISHRVASSMEYLLRAPLKNGLEDLKKARRNLDQAIEYYENNELKEL